MKTVLIVDDDLGFLFWLGHALGAAGFESLPATSVEDARRLLEELRVPLDLLIANPALPRIPAFVTAVHSSQAYLKVISLAAPGDARLGRVDAYCAKPAVPDEDARVAWLAIVRSVLESHPAPQ